MTAGSLTREPKIHARSSHVRKGATQASNEGWLTGFEPAISRSTIWIPPPPHHDQDSDLRPPSRALSPPLPTDTCRTDPDLAAVVAAWPSLPEALKAGIVAMVGAATGRPVRSRRC